MTAVIVERGLEPSTIFATDDFKQGRIGVWGKKLTTYEEICEEFGIKPVEGPKP